MTQFIALSTGTQAGSKIAVDRISVGATAVDFQIVKLAIGASGAQTVVHSGNRLPVITTTGSLIAVRATGTALAVKVSGSVTIVEPVTISGVVRVSGNVNLAEPVTISGSITSITNTVVTKVSGTVAVAEPVTVSGTIIALISGSVAYLDYNTSTGTTQNRLSFGIIVPTTGGARAAGGTGRSLKVGPTGSAFPVKVSGSVTVAEPLTISGTITDITNTITVNVSGNVTIAEPVTISGAVKVSGTVGLRADYVDEATFTAGTDRIIAIGARFGTDVVGASGDIGIIRMTSGRVLLVTGISPGAGSTGVSIKAWDATQTVITKVSGTVAIAEPITISGSITSITNAVSVKATGTALVVKTSGNVSIAEPVTISGSITSITNAVSVKATGTALVVKVSGTVAITEPITISGTITDITNPITISGNVNVQGLVAHDASATGSTRPVLIAGRARVTEPTAVATGDVSYLWSDLQGRQVVILNTPAQPRSTGTAGHGPRYFRLTTTAVATMIATPGAGQSIHITLLHPSNIGVANTLSVFESGDTATGGKGYRARFASAGGGSVVKFDPPWKLTANKLLAGRLDSASTGMLVNVHYYVSP